MEFAVGGLGAIRIGRESLRGRLQLDMIDSSNE